MFAHRATYLVAAEICFLLGVALAEVLNVAEPFHHPTVAWFALSLVAIGFHFNDRRLVMWLALFSLSLVAGLVWNNSLGEGSAWQFPQFGLFDTLAQVREHFVSYFARSLPPPYGNLVSSIVVGGRGLLSETLRQQFIATGTLHLFAVSGYNVTIVLKIFADWLRWLSPKLGFLIGSLIIVAFAALVGGQASVVRASILAWLLLFGRLIGRQGSILPLTVLAATLMVIHKPSILLHDIGFQLSFLAFLGLVYISPLLEQRMIKLEHWIPKNFIAIAATTLGAQVAVLPLLLFHFGQLTPLSPIVNFLVLPIVPVMTIGALVIGVLGSMAGQILLPLAYPLYPAAWYMVEVTGWFARLPGSQIAIKHWPWWLTVLSYVSIYLIVSHFWRKRNVPSSQAQT